ncbi:hypothetical protein Asppvi_010753 [Aspergillus pseudoviridinutans]|uniref:Uncharacterized protein n=1 Tax=Aspergillus pseudoviridinutans TaxID=1517512 RepID=A0A9P3F0D9_9EURO|nr:uncharacterized protein Asppvi_010753 [Aspergillus pseudoviridinutans]GIJ91780.1 hypothetical protein Asppvi_010753 [Aspergillus pseudoviridinutans]
MDMNDLDSLKIIRPLLEYLISQIMVEDDLDSLNILLELAAQALHKDISEVAHQGGEKVSRTVVARLYRVYRLQHCVYIPTTREQVRAFGSNVTVRMSRMQLEWGEEYKKDQDEDYSPWYMGRLDDAGPTATGSDRILPILADD